MLQPKVKTFELAVDGGPVEKLESTALFRTNATVAVLANFKATGIEVKELTEGADGDEVSDIGALSEAVMPSVIQFVYQTPSPEKVTRFDYSLGPLGPLLDREGADALIVVWGRALVPTLGRTVMNALAGGPPQQAMLAVAIVDRSGSLLWFNFASAAGSGDHSDMTDPGAADEMAKTALSGLNPPASQR